MGSTTIERSTPVSRSGLIADADEGRQQILAAAERVVLRYGVSKTTMDDIGKEAAVSRPTVYRYFGDRDALLGALFERRSRMLFERARTFILSHDTFTEQLIEGLVYLVDHGRKDPIVRVLVSPEHDGVGHPDLSVARPPATGSCCGTSCYPHSCLSAHRSLEGATNLRV